MSDKYISMTDVGLCMVCQKKKDRRYGVCFECSEFVVTGSGHAWDTRNPDTKWPVSESGKLLAARKGDDDER
jgi:hypothetical protein